MRRDWREAVARHDSQPCRVCLRWPRELAHVIPRTFDRQRGTLGVVVRVDPLSVVPLCDRHHWLYDSHRLDLTPHLTREELDRAASVVGRVEALRRISGGRAAT